MLPDLIGKAVEIIPLHRRTYNQDGLVTLYSTSFASERDFGAAYAEAVKPTLGTTATFTGAATFFAGQTARRLSAW
ncbi:MAG TPA: hypothetical protein PLB55_07840 [Prosthecobacter sp.]|jgi:hypothetical protein|nr:hypothetical protein [Prosthecobacter sp.]